MLAIENGKANPNAGLTRKQQNALATMQRSFVTNEWKMQGKIYDSMVKSTGGELNNVHGFKRGGLITQFHTEDINEIMLVEQMRPKSNDPGEIEDLPIKKNDVYEQFEIIANHRNKNEFLKHVLQNFDSFVDYLGPKGDGIDEFKQGFRAHLQDAQREHEQWINAYKKHVVKSMDIGTELAITDGTVVGEERTSNKSFQPTNAMKIAAGQERNTFFRTLIEPEPEALDFDVKMDFSIDEDEPEVEETKVEETKVEETKVEETKVEEAKVEEPKIEEPTAEISKTEGPKVETPAIEVPTVSQPEPEAQFTAPDRYPIDIDDLKPTAKPKVQPQSPGNPRANYSILDFILEALGIKKLIKWFSTSSEDIQADANNLGKMKKIQQPYKDALDKANASEKHLYNMTEDFYDSDFVKADVITNMSRTNTRVGAYSAYMLYKGMSLKDIASTDSKFDDEKKGHMADFHGIIMDAANDIHSGGNNAKLKALEDYDNKFNREKFANDYMANLKGDELAKMNALSPDEKNKKIDIAAKNARDTVGQNSWNKGAQEAKNTSPAVQKYRDIYLGMGVAISEQKIPLKSLNNPTEILKNYDMLKTLNTMTHDYASNLAPSKLGTQGMDKATLEKVSNAVLFVGNYTGVANSFVDYAASDTFTDPAKFDPKKPVPIRTDYFKFGMARGAQEMFGEFDKELKGKDNFSQIPIGKGLEMANKVSMEGVKACDKSLSANDTFKNPLEELKTNLDTFKVNQSKIKTKEPVAVTKQVEPSGRKI